MDRFFSLLSRIKSVLNFKIRSRTGKTKDFSSPAAEVYFLDKTNTLFWFVDRDPIYKGTRGFSLKNMT